MDERSQGGLVDRATGRTVVVARKVDTVNNYGVVDVPSRVHSTRVVLMCVGIIGVAACVLIGLICPFPTAFQWVVFVAALAVSIIMVLVALFSPEWRKRVLQVGGPVLGLLLVLNVLTRNIGMQVAWSGRVDVMQKLLATRSAMCACKDLACVEAVDDGTAAWLEQMRAKVSPSRLREISQNLLLDEATRQCREKIVSVKTALLCDLPLRLYHLDSGSVGGSAFCRVPPNVDSVGLRVSLAIQTDEGDENLTPLRVSFCLGSGWIKVCPAGAELPPHGGIVDVEIPNKEVPHRFLWNLPRGLLFEVRVDGEGAFLLRKSRIRVEAVRRMSPDYHDVY